MSNFEAKIAELNAKAQQDALAERERAEEEARERAKKNDNFFMVFKTKEGAERLRQLINKSGAAAQVFMLLAEQADRTNAVVASGKALATCLGLSEPTISRAIKLLQTADENELPYLEVLKSGGTNVFILNPDIVWSAWKTGKDHCLFGQAKVLVTASEQDKAFRRRLNVLLAKQTELELR